MCWGGGRLPDIVFQNEIIFLDSLFSVQKGKKITNSLITGMQGGAIRLNSPVSSLLHRKRGGGWFLPCTGGLCLLSVLQHRFPEAPTANSAAAVIQDSLESTHWYLVELPWHEWAASVLAQAK